MSAALVGVQKDRKRRQDEYEDQLNNSLNTSLKLINTLNTYLGLDHPDWLAVAVKKRKVAEIRKN